MMKKILILGATYTENVIIERAKKKGIYTIVTDNNLDYSKSPAKYFADEAWDISWSDVDSLYIKCKENNINAVLAGFSEFRVENMIKLCSKLNLPCYLTLEQLNITRDKIKFKQLCRQYDISCVPEYKYEDEMSFPLIIKPVDRAGSIGINVVYNQEDFDECYNYALSLSPTKNVIIEKFINDGIKVDSYYYVLNGNVTLLGTSDTIMCDGTDAASILQKGWVFPSIYEKKYLEDVDSKVRKMLKGLNFRNGYVTFSAFFVDNQFYFFEAGFRLSGEMSFNYYNCLKGINYIDLLIDYSLGIELDVSLEDAVNSNAYSVILNFFCNNGTVDYLVLPEEKAHESIVALNVYVKKGDIIFNETTVLKKAVMYTLFSTNSQKIVEGINYINGLISIKNANNNDIIYEKVNPNVLGYDYLCKEENVTFLFKPYYVTYLMLQNLLAESHLTNIKKGLRYATMTQTVESLKEKCNNADVFVAMTGDKLIGTGTIQYRSINYWYHTGPIGLLKLLAVSPKFRGHNIGSILFEKRIEQAKLVNEKLVLVVDSAEQNKIIEKISLKYGFKKVDCCLYKGNNFYSTVYAKWLGVAPWCNLYIFFKYHLKRLYVHFKYKPGKIERFKFLSKFNFRIF